MKQVARLSSRQRPRRSAWIADDVAASTRAVAVWWMRRSAELPSALPEQAAARGRTVKLHGRARSPALRPAAALAASRAAASRRRRARPARAPRGGRDSPAARRCRSGSRGATRPASRASSRRSSLPRGAARTWAPHGWALVLGVWADGDLAGTQSVEAVDFAANRTVSTGSWLGERFQRRGFGTRCARRCSSSRSPGSARPERSRGRSRERRVGARLGEAGLRTRRRGIVSRAANRSASPSSCSPASGGRATGRRRSPSRVSRRACRCSG